MRILVITSCTGEKSVEHARKLTIADFKAGAQHMAARENELVELMTRAEELYSGEQQIRLMRGVRTLRDHGGPDIDLWILSAGYGLVTGKRKLAPYEATFQGMHKGDLRQWADQLGVPTALRKVLAKPYDLGIVLLGDSYLEACMVDADLKLGGPTLLFCGGNMAKRLPKIDGMKVVPLSNAEAKRFSCGLVGLKGEIAKRLLEQIGRDAEVATQVMAPAEDVLQLLEGASEAKFSSVKEKARPNPSVDFVIRIPKEWWDQPHKKKLMYYIPEWDDLVDPDYNFETDTHSGGTGDWSNEVYAHQMYPEPNYDGLLVSKVVAEKSKKKKERINELGVHRFLRVPQEFPIIGDCGAFGYIGEEVPPYTTDEILDYYTRIGFNYGASIDHLIVTATEAQRQFRYDLTVHNAEEFIREHKKRELTWEPLGAVQGWDPKSYAQAARQYVDMGYRYIALGGLVRTSTKDVLRILEAVHQVVPERVAIHLFGLARISALADFARLGVRSVDSASFLRQAWMRDSQGYLLADGRYAALRIPEGGKSFRAKRMVAEKGLDEGKALRMEAAALRAVRDLAANRCSVESCLDALLEYDQYIGADRSKITDLYRKTLTERPWERCGCELCRESGVEIIIFRGNNRNRRRGFHNIYVFYRLMQRILAGEKVTFGPESDDEDKSAAQQLPLFTFEKVLRR